MDRSIPAEQETNGRRAFLRNAAKAATVAGVAGVAGAATLAPTEAWATEANPVLIKQAFMTIKGDEDAHVPAVIQAIQSIGGTPRPKPTFMKLPQTQYLAFFKASRIFENTGVGAYLGAAPYIYNYTVLSAAASIAFIEARHSGFLNALLNANITSGITMSSQHFETPLTIPQVLSLVNPYVASLNGGPDLTFSTTPSTANDIAILNFALALEYLEMAYYDINVPKFFPGTLFH